MKTWIPAVIIFVLGTAASAAYLLYNSVENPLEARADQAEERAYAAADIAEVEERTFFHGRESFIVLHTLTADGTPQFVFVPERTEEEENAGEITVVDRSGGIPPEEAAAQAEEETEAVELISVLPGLESGEPVYEVRYRDEEGRYGYYYTSFNDGSYLRNYLLPEEPA
ncbi:DUF5590 domain-containing protein [Alkalicoccus urumqiensis]|uniref:Uncharacterized protein n=1 Tax=Alkalicoccus urumqiensis TaxID=1548213 RepID=A0A2P6MKN7_ALKUR|nr:DUF5590 domain-containing protein [Alkalicoccus urumqiensis]PRO66846.1 hypothetical protein C6I21_02675 [Alkalicoccus urumqiensis]